MKIREVTGVYWSATGNTKKITERLTEALAAALGCTWKLICFTMPEDRSRIYTFHADEAVVVGSPVYAGKLPNKILPDFREKLTGNGALAVAAVTFGNRTAGSGKT